MSCHAEENLFVILIRFGMRAEDKLDAKTLRMLISKGIFSIPPDPHSVSGAS